MLILLGTILLNDVLIHDCVSDKSNPQISKNEPIDYQISCSNDKIQKIKISNNKKIKSITISKNSSVDLDCSINIDEPNGIDLIIYDNPKMFIKNKCNLNSLIIYGTPIFEFSHESMLKFDFFEIYNETYTFPFESPNIFYSHKDSKKNSDIIYDQKNNEKLSIIDETIKNNCSKSKEINIYIGEQALLKCNYESNLILDYDEFSNYQINVKYDLVFMFTDYNKSLYDHMKKIAPSIHFGKNSRLIFSDLADAGQIESFFDLFNQKEIPKFMTFTWDNYMEDQTHYYFQCPFEFRVFLDKYNYLEEYLNYLDENTRWRKLCLGSNGYLMYFDEPQKIIEIPKNAFLALLISGLVLIFVMTVSFCIIGGYRYKKDHE